MARLESKNVSYFPCDCKDGKVLFILESRWGNNGWAFFYKLWKRLGDADYHYIDLRPQDNWEYFRAKMGVSDAETLEILGKLAEMKVIDPEMWAHKIIWSDSFVERVTDVWLKRKGNIPQKPTFLIQKQELPERKSAETVISGAEVHKEKESKEKKIKAAPAPSGTNGSVPPIEQISDMTDPEVENNLKTVTEKLYRDGIFKDVPAFLNSMMKKKENPRAVLRALIKCYKDPPKDPWPYCLKIVREDGPDCDASRSRKECEEHKRQPGLTSMADLLGMKGEKG